MFPLFRDGHFMVCISFFLVLSFQHFLCLTNTCVCGWCPLFWQTWILFPPEQALQKIPPPLLLLLVLRPPPGAVLSWTQGSFSSPFCCPWFISGMPRWPRVSPLPAFTGSLSKLLITFKTSLKFFEMNSKATKLHQAETSSFLQARRHLRGCDLRSGGSGVCSLLWPSLCALINVLTIQCLVIYVGTYLVKWNITAQFSHYERKEQKLYCGLLYSLPG